MVLKNLGSSSKGIILALGVVFTAILGVMDYWTGWETAFSVFYLLPVLFVTTYGGRWSGIVVALASAGMWLYADHLLGTLYSKPFLPYWNALMRFGFFIIVAYYSSSLKTLAETLDKMVEERTISLTNEIAERRRVEEQLRTALGEIKSLSGLLQICSSCKRIREDDGSWQQLEAYIVGHSEAQFTHGLCPECLKNFYPQFAEKRPIG